MIEHTRRSQGSFTRKSSTTVVEEPRSRHLKAELFREILRAKEAIQDDRLKQSLWALVLGGMGQQGTVGSHLVRNT
jgi:hypothetical protein